MEHQRFCLGDHHRGLFLLQFLHMPVPQIRIEPVEVDADEDLLQKLHRGLHQQVQQEVLCQKQHDDLYKDRDDLRDRRNIGLNIVALLRIGQAVFIGHKISADRIEQKDQIINRQLPDRDAPAFLDQIRQKGRQCKADHRDHARDGQISLPVKPHIGFDLLLIPVCHRLVQAVVHGAANAQFRQGEHTENIRIQAVYPQQGFAQHPDKDRSLQKPHTQDYEIADITEEDILPGLSDSAHFIGLRSFFLPAFQHMI